MDDRVSRAFLLCRLASVGNEKDKEFVARWLRNDQSQVAFVQGFRPFSSAEAPPPQTFLSPKRPCSVLSCPFNHTVYAPFPLSELQALLQVPVPDAAMRSMLGQLQVPERLLKVLEASLPSQACNVFTLSLTS